MNKSVEKEHICFEMKKLNNEKGSVSLYAFVAMLILLTIVLGIYIYYSQKYMQNLEITKQIKTVYEKDVANIADIYSKLDAQVEVKEDDNPNVSIKMEKSASAFGIKATIIINDTDMQIDYANTKYVFTNSKTKLGTDDSNLYTEGVIEQNEYVIEKAKGKGTYFLHVLVTDTSGNAMEVVSKNAVTITADEVNFSYTGREETLNLLPGVYKLEAWGAQGGSAGEYTGGYGGYSVGNINLSTNTNLFINVGGVGESNGITSNAVGGYNGGGSSVVNNEYAGNYTAGGGGATSIATRTGRLSELVGYQNDVLIVAGGRRRCLLQFK